MKINKYSPVPVLTRTSISAIPISLYGDKVHQWDGVVLISENTPLYYLGYINSWDLAKYAYLIYQEHKNYVICIRQCIDQPRYSCISNDDNDSLDRPLTDTIRNIDDWSKFDEAILRAYFND